MYKVTNKTKEERKFRDGFLGEDIIVGPGESVLTRKPPVEDNIWKVEEAEKSEEKKPKSKQKEDKQE